MAEEESGSDEVPSDPEIIEQILNDPEFLTPEMKLDQDLNYILAHIPLMYKNVKEENEMQLCDAWMNKLLGKRLGSIEEKRERNLYLINLMLNMGDGKLKNPFDRMPPSVLEKGLYVFGAKVKSEVCYENQEIEVEDFAEYSKDERTYFASKALPGGKGAFGYLGVSVGGGDAVWLNTEGNCVDPKTLIRKSSCDPESKEDANNETMKELRNILSKRSPQKERTELISYYEELLGRIKKITCFYGTDQEIQDAAIEKMLQELQMDILRDGKLELSDIGCYDKRQWLCALKKKIEFKIETALKRDEELDNLEKTLTEHNVEDVAFLDMTNAIKPPKLDPILAEAARDRPSDYNVTILKRKYPECVVKIFMQLLEQEKLFIINQERLSYQNFVINLRSEILNEVKVGLHKYSAARKEWRRISKVLRSIEETKARLLKEVEKVSTVDDPEFHEKDDFITHEIDSAKNRLEAAQDQSDKIEQKIGDLHDKVHQLTTEYQKMEYNGKMETETLLKEITGMQIQIGGQERQILMLRHKIKEKEQMQDCEGKKREC